MLSNFDKLTGNMQLGSSSRVAGCDICSDYHGVLVAKCMPEFCGLVAKYARIHLTLEVWLKYDTIRYNFYQEWKPPSLISQN